MFRGRCAGVDLSVWGYLRLALRLPPSGQMRRAPDMRFRWRNRYTDPTRRQFVDLRSPRGSLFEKACPLEPGASPVSSFRELGVTAELSDSLVARGITAPYPIQAATLPDALAGRDVCGRAP